jgi:hypothetical protein
LVCQKKLAEKNKKMQILLAPGKEFEKDPSRHARSLLPHQPPLVIPAPFCHSRESGNPLEISVNPDTMVAVSAPLEVRQQLLTGSEKTPYP